MTTTEDIQKASAWFAEKCGIKLYSMSPNKAVTPRFARIHGIHVKFDIRDVMCREVCRERFKVETSHHDEDIGWYCGTLFEGAEFVTGNTIPEAEIACLMAIYNGRNNDE